MTSLQQILFNGRAQPVSDHNSDHSCWSTSGSSGWRYCCHIYFKPLRGRERSSSVHW